MPARNHPVVGNDHGRAPFDDEHYVHVIIGGPAIGEEFISKELHLVGPHIVTECTLYRAGSQDPQAIRYANHLYEGSGDGVASPTQ